MQAHVFHLFIIGLCLLILLLLEHKVLSLFSPLMVGNTSAKHRNITFYGPSRENNSAAKSQPISFLKYPDTSERKMPEMWCYSEMVQPDLLPERKEGETNKIKAKKTHLKIFVTKSLKDRLQVQQKQQSLWTCGLWLYYSMQTLRKTRLSVHG